MRTLDWGDEGPEVRKLQELLARRGQPVTVDGEYGLETQAAVRAFQAQHLDARGEPLGVDGIAGPGTWWSLTHPQPLLAHPVVVDFSVMPIPELGGSPRGRHALEVAIHELGASEPATKYLQGLAPDDTPWCAAFVSWCFAQDPSGTPFPYTVSARDLFARLGQRGWAHFPGEGYSPRPGDIVAWWSQGAEGWQAHVGLVHHAAYATLFTLEGSRGPRVRGFHYPLHALDQLLGFAQVPGP